jgi:tRNA A-37 threonylcarbamoyl transferase component Bud32
MNLGDITGYETLGGGPWLVVIRPDWKSWLLEDLVDDFRRVDATRRKTHAHGRVEHFSYHPKGAPARVFVRRAAHGGIFGAFAGGIYTDLSRPLRELRAAQVARGAGVNVAEPLAVLATRVAGPFYRLTMISREVENASNLLALRAEMTGQLKRELICRVADEMRRLHEAGVYHADLTLKNILVHGSSVTIIDLDKARLLGRRDETMDIRNLARFNRSVVKLLGKTGLVTRTDKLRFLRAYLRGSDRLRELSRLCGAGLWAHRLWWSVSGQA